MGKQLKSTPVGMWVIPNGSPGELWTPIVFESEADARAYWTRFWSPMKREMPRTHQPVFAAVQLVAEVPAASTENRDG